MHSSLRARARLPLWGALIGAWAVSAPAFAFFQEATPVRSVSLSPTHSMRLARSAPAIGNGPGVIIQGPVSAPARASQAHNIPLQDALTLLLPAGYRYRPHRSASEVDPPVSWQGVAPWTARLGELGRAEDLQFVVNGPHHLVTARLAAPALSSRLMPVPQSPLRALPLRPRIVIPTWRVPADIPLSRTLKSWGRTAHWTVVWHGPSWVPETRLTVSGTFLHAIRQVVGDLRQQGAPGFIRADVYAGRLVIIRAQAPRRDHHDR